MVSEGRKRHVTRAQGKAEALEKYASLAANLGRQPVGRRESRKRILLVCEGEKTEPQYFRWLRDRWRLNATIEIIGPCGDPLCVVQRAVDEKRRARDPRYDSVWAVFDRDDFVPSRISGAFQLASSNEVKVAYSNECFELWYLLHFCYVDAALQRGELWKKLSDAIGYEYKKEETKIFEKLKDRFVNAIRNALRLEEVNGAARQSPYTGVHRILEEFAGTAGSSRPIEDETGGIRAIFQEWKSGGS